MPPLKEATEKVVNCKDFKEKSSAIFDCIDRFVMKNEIKEKAIASLSLGPLRSLTTESQKIKAIILYHNALR